MIEYLFEHQIEEQRSRDQELNGVVEEVKDHHGYFQPEFFILNQNRKHANHNRRKPEERIEPRITQFVISNQLRSRRLENQTDRVQSNIKKLQSNTSILHFPREFLRLPPRDRTQRSMPNHKN